MSRLLRRHLGALVWSVAASFIISGEARSQTSQSFYATHQINLLVPSGPGGGYDAYARLMARHLGSHIPGRPTITVQNMPGAGGVIVANYLANVAPKDGTVIAIMQNGIPFKPLFDPRLIKFTKQSFRWLGSVTSVTNTAVVPKNSPIESVDDIFHHTLVVGASGGTSAYLPAALNRILGTKFDIVKGYKSTNDILLALDRKEVSGLVGIALDSLEKAKSAHPNLRVLFQMGIHRNNTLPDIPLIQEYAKTKRQKSILNAIFSSFQIGRIFATPTIKPSRLKILRNAFAATVSDPAFIKDAHNSHLDVAPQTPAEVEQTIDAVYREPKPVLEAVKRIMLHTH